MPPRPARLIPLRPLLATAASLAGGEIAALALPDGSICRGARTGATLVFEGRPFNFDCGTSGVDRVTLADGDMEAAEGGVRIVRARIAHGGSGLSLRSSETIPVTSPR
jgi:hypothetical protein